MTCVFTGATVGSISAFLISSQFCSLKVDNGWPFSFYFSGNRTRVLQL
jgi:hypothetical protein